MATRINCNPITDATIDTFSKWNIANEQIKAIDKTYKESVKKVEKELKAQLDNREVEIKNGMNKDEVIAKFPIEQFYAKLESLKIKHNKDIKPYKDDKKACYKLLGLDNPKVYASYVLAFETRSNDAIGGVTLNKGKKSQENVSVNSSFNEQIRKALTNMGLNADNELALNKFTKDIVFILGGGIADKKGDSFIVERNENAFDDLYVRAFLRIFVVDKHVLDLNDDNTLTRHNWDEVDLTDYVNPTVHTNEEIKAIISASEELAKKCEEERKNNSK